MKSSDIDPVVRRGVADAVLERASSALGKILEELAAALDPFPSFLGMSSIHAVEVEPVGVNPDKGCVVVCPDGRMYELLLRMVPGPIDFEGLEQTEELKELDLSSGDYVAYACAAVTELARIPEDRTVGHRQ